MAAPVILGIQYAAATAGDGAAVLFATGPLNSETLNLLNSTLDVKISPSNVDPSSQSQLKSSLKSISHEPPALCAGAAPSGPLVLALEGLDSVDDASSVEKSLALAVSLSGAIMLTVRMPDLARPASSGVRQVMSAIGKSLSLRMSGIASPLPTRRLLVVAVRDFDSEEISAEELEEALTEQLASAYKDIEVPSGFAGNELSDLFNLHIVGLPNEQHCAEQYAGAVRELGDVLRDTNKSYADAGMTEERLGDFIAKIQIALGDEATGNLPAERELRATYACNAVMKSVLDKYRNTAKQWKATVDAGRVIRNFGSENDRLIERTVDVYDKDASVYKSTKAFQRKKDELKGFLLSDSYALFAKQILKVRENAYQVFRAKLARIRINDQVEKNVRGAVKEAESFFVEHGEALRSKLGAWRFDNERHELVNHMRDDATERLQLARLQGNYVPRIRAPIAFAFHTLLLAPFGRDSAAAQPHAEDMKQSYDPDKVKQAELYRVRPHQVGVTRHVRRFKDALGDDYADRWNDFYAEIAGDK